MVFVPEPVQLNQKEMQTIEAYNSRVEYWVAKEGYACPKRAWQSQLERFNHYLPQGSIIDLGCGPGNQVSWFIEKGYKYTGLDPAENLLLVLERHFPQATFIEEELCSLDLAGQQYDGFWCTAVFIHIEKEHAAQALANIKKIIKAGGIGFIALLEGVGEYYDEATGRWFFLYSDAEFSDLLEKHGFKIKERNISEKRGKWGPEARWMSYFIQA